MKDFKFIELPKEEVLSEVELSFIEGAATCTNYTVCAPAEGKKSSCGSYSTGTIPCDCGSGLYCSNYTF